MDENGRVRTARALWLLVAALPVLLPRPAASAIVPAAETASVAGYGEATFVGEVGWSVYCPATQPLRSFAVVFSIESQSLYSQFGWGGGAQPIQGRSVRVATHEVVIEERVEEAGPRGFSYGNGIAVIGDPEVVTLRVAWATWGHSTCSFFVDGERTAWSPVPADRAVHVGPTEFGAGVLVQEGTASAAAGQTHVFETSGKAMAYMEPAWRGAGAFARSDGRSAFCIGSCAYSDRVAGALVAAVPAAVGIDGAGTDVWVIDVPLEILG